LPIAKSTTQRVKSEIRNRKSVIEDFYSKLNQV
jgi:hypothetical protein